MTTPTAADVARDAQTLQENDEPDSFPPEGTDEHTLDPDAPELDEAQRRKATEAVIKAGY